MFFQLRSWIFPRWLKIIQFKVEKSCEFWITIVVSTHAFIIFSLFKEIFKSLKLSILTYYFVFLQIVYDSPYRHVG